MSEFVNLASSPRTRRLNLNLPVSGFLYLSRKSLIISIVRKGTDIKKIERHNPKRCDVLILQVSFLVIPLGAFGDPVGRFW